MEGYIISLCSGRYLPWQLKNLWGICHILPEKNCRILASNHLLPYHPISSLPLLPLASDSPSLQLRAPECPQETLCRKTVLFARVKRAMHTDGLEGSTHLGSPGGFLSCFVLVKLYMKQFLSSLNKPSTAEIASLPFNPYLLTLFLLFKDLSFFSSFLPANKLSCPLAATFALFWPRKNCFQGSLCPNR